MGKTKVALILIALIAALVGKPAVSSAQLYPGLGGIPLGFSDEECKKMNGLCSESVQSPLGYLACAPQADCCVQDADCPSTDICHPAVCEKNAGAAVGQCRTTTRPSCSLPTPMPPTETESCVAASDCPYAGACSEASCVQGSCAYHLPTGKTYADLPDECRCSDSDGCEDENSCTLDSCKDLGDRRGFCLHKAAPLGTSCDDGIFCNGSESCDGGQCMRDAPPCEDENDTDCTETVCDEATDQCIEKTWDCHPLPTPPTPAPQTTPPPPETEPLPEPSPAPVPVDPTPTPIPAPSATPATPEVSCEAGSPEDVYVAKDGTRVIFAITREGQPTPVRLQAVSSEGSEKRLAGVENIEWRQDGGTTLVSSSAPSDEKEIKSLTEPTVLASPSATFQFVAPLPYAGRGKAIETYSFTATAKDISGRILWSAPVQCQIGLEIKGGGAGGCSLDPIK